MFSSDHNISSLRELMAELKVYVNLRAELLRLDFVSKLTILLSAIAVTGLLMLLLAIAFLFLSYSIVGVLEEWLDSVAMANLLMAGFYLLLAGIVYGFRARWIVRPIAGFLGQLFLPSHHQKEDPS